MDKVIKFDRLIPSHLDESLNHGLGRVPQAWLGTSPSSIAWGDSIKHNNFGGKSLDINRGEPSNVS